MGKRKSKALLLAVALLIMALGMGSVVYAATEYKANDTVRVYSLEVGDVLKKGAILDATFSGDVYYKIDDEDEKFIPNPGEEITLPADLKVDKIERLIPTSNESGYTKIYLKTISSSTSGGGSTTDTPDSGATDAPDSGSTDTPASSTSEDKSESNPVDPVQAWKTSNANPENYLPKITLADGTTVQSTVASHFAGNASAAVIVTTPEGDFNKALGITGGYAHLMGSTSQCGEKLKAAFADYAKVLGENLGVELTLGDIFDLKTEVREKGTYKLLDTVTESGELVTLSRGLQGEMLKAAKVGYDFAVICYTDGKAVLCKDVDTEVSTITINTTITSGTYAIIYGPKGCFDGIE